MHGHALEWEWVVERGTVEQLWGTAAAKLALSPLSAHSRLYVVISYCCCSNKQWTGEHMHACTSSSMYSKSNLLGMMEKSGTAAGPGVRWYEYASGAAPCIKKSEIRRGDEIEVSTRSSSTIPTLVVPSR